MALGGGTWVTQNKVLPGSYINFTSVAKASAVLSDRGYAASPFTLSWGPEEEIFKVESGDFQKNSKTIFGYSYDAPEMLALREIFAHATTVYCYRLGVGAEKASNDYAEAKYPGTRGNDITIVIAADADEEGKFDVSTYLSGIRQETQVVETMADLVDNDWVCFKNDVDIAETAGMPLEGGTDVEEIAGDSYQTFLDKLEAYSFNTLCCPTDDQTTISLFAQYTERMRDEVGSKFQLVCYQPETVDYEGVIGVWNPVTHSTIEDVPEWYLVYWLTGAEAGVAVNKSLTNTKYDGELTVDVNNTQSELEAAIKAGQLMMHNVNGDVRILEDINTLLTLTDEKGEIFQSNQTMRVCDQIANDTAVIFNTRYVGAVPNDASGRASLWGDVCALIQQLDDIRAVENFDDNIVTCEQGGTKKSVLLIINGLDIVNAMSQLYMSVVIQ